VHILLDFGSIPVIYSQLPLGVSQASYISNSGDAPLTEKKWASAFNVEKH
jgi:hypothetical protein